MDCCGHGHGICHGHALTRRQWMWSTVLSSVGAMLAGGVGPRGSTAAAQTAETASAALEVLRKSISVDVHTHGGTTGITSQAPPNDSLANGMRAGSLAVACLADVPDGPILGRNPAGVLAALRTPEPGQLYKYHLGRLDWVDEMVAHHGLRRALSAADLEAAHAKGQPAIVGDVEGLDFLEGKLERLEQAHQRGVRHVQLVHYTPNDIGDFQTGVVTHQGLTSVRRRGDPRLPSARICLRCRACDRGHGEGGGQGRYQAPAAVAHCAFRIPRDGRNAAHGAADQPRPRACNRRDRRRNRHLALLLRVSKNMSTA